MGLRIAVAPVGLPEGSQQCELQVGLDELRVNREGLRVLLAGEVGIERLGHDLLGPEVVGVGLQAPGDREFHPDLVRGDLLLRLVQRDPGSLGEPVDESEHGGLVRCTFLDREQVLVPFRIERAQLDEERRSEPTDRREQEGTGVCPPANLPCEGLIETVDVPLSELPRVVPHSTSRQDSKPLRLLERRREESREAVQLRIAGLVREVRHCDRDPSDGNLAPPDAPGGDSRREHAEEDPRAGEKCHAAQDAWTGPLPLKALNDCKPGGSVARARGRVGGDGGFDLALDVPR